MRKPLMILTALGLLGLTASAFAAEVVRTETTTRGYRHTYTTTAGIFTLCGEYGNRPRCDEHSEAAYRGGLVHQAIRLPSGKVVTGFPFGQVGGGPMSGIGEMGGNVYLFTMTAVHRYDPSGERFEQVYTSGAHYIRQLGVSPYLGVGGIHGRSQFNGLLRLEGGSWKLYPYQGPLRPSADEIGEEGPFIRLTHVGSDDVTLFDPRDGTYRIR